MKTDFNHSHSSHPSDYQVGIGAMTGTSLDGVDLALCEFANQSFEILAFDCLDIPDDLKNALRNVHLSQSQDYFRIENEFSRFLATRIKQFYESNGRKAQFLGIHGQTVFHQPEVGITTQMLDGGLIAIKTGLPTVCDFRRADIALGGQGAPLVPVGDRDLFADYAACLNLGGFANISMSRKDERIAFDICPVNFVLNHLAKNEGLDYDDRGEMAASGELNTPILEKLNALDFYKINSGKSLGREWVEKEIFPILSDIENRSALRTFTTHAAKQIARNLPSNGQVLITGGGAYNEFLLNEISRFQPQLKLSIPDKVLLEGKEALIFAYLAKLRLEGKINVLASTTGASRDSSSGAIYFPS